jgi:hypothetical protein
MAKAKGKPKETVLLIRIPDAEARRGEASLAIQRGDLGHLSQFTYTGLTLHGNIAEAVQAALIALTRLEMAPPPPRFNTPATPAQAETAVTTDVSTEENDSDTDDDEVDTSDGAEGAEGEASSEGDEDDDTAPPVITLGIESETPAESSEHTTSASLLMSTTGDVIPTDTAQMSLF